MSNINKMRVNRRSVISGIGAGLVAPMFFVKNGWAQGKTINVGTYPGVQGEYIRNEVIPQFQRDYDCRVNQSEGVTLTQIGLMRVQKANPTYTVMCMDESGTPIAAQEGLIEKLPFDDMPNLQKIFTRFLLTDGHAAAYTSFPVAPFYNTNVAPIESWANLWDDRFRNRFMIITPTKSPSVLFLIATAAIVTGRPLNEAQDYIDQAWEKVAEIKPNIQTIYDNAVTGILQLSQGQADIGGPDASKVVLDYTMRGSPVDMVYPKEGAFLATNAATLVKGGPNRDLGVAFIDRLFEHSVQSGFAEKTWTAPSVGGIEISAKLRPHLVYPEEQIIERNLVIADWEKLIPQRSAIVEKLNSVLLG